MDKIEHRPLPWQQSHRKHDDDMYSTEIYDASGETIATVSWYPVKTDSGSIVTSREANAAFIVTACNAYYDLQQRNAALSAALKLLHDNLAEYQHINNLGGYDNHDMKMARAALAANGDVP